MDTAKIVADPAGGYLAVSHAGDSVNLATSADLLTWTVHQTLDPQATQPTITALPTGGWLTAVEYNSQRGAGAFLRCVTMPTGRPFSPATSIGNAPCPAPCRPVMKALPPSDR